MATEHNGSNARRGHLVTGISACGVVVVLTGAWTSSAHGQETAPAETTMPSLVDEAGLHFTFMPAVWLPRPRGTSLLGPSSLAADLDLNTDLKLDDSDPAFTADISVRKDQQWQLRAGGFDYSTDSHGEFDGQGDFGGLSLGDGDEFAASFDMTSFNLETTYWFNLVEGKNGTHLLLGPTAGFRYVDVDQTVEQIGVGIEKTGGEWVAAYLGGELELRWNCRDKLPWIEQVQIAGGAAVGAAMGVDGGSLFQVHADLTLMFTANFGAFFGYKLVEVYADSGEYTLEGGIEGLYIGGVLRF